MARMTALDTYAHRVHVGPQIFARLALSTTLQALRKSSRLRERSFPCPRPSTAQQNLHQSAKCAGRTKHVSSSLCTPNEQSPWFKPSLASSPSCFCQWNNLLGGPVHSGSQANDSCRKMARWHRFTSRHARPPTTRTCVTHPENPRQYQKKMSCAETSHSLMGHAHGQNSRSCVGSLRRVTFISSRNTPPPASQLDATPSINQTTNPHRSSSASFRSEDPGAESRPASVMGMEHADRQCRETVAQDELGRLRECPRDLQ